MKQTNIAFCNRKQINDYLWPDEGGDLSAKSTREIFEAIKTPYKIILVVISVYTLVKICQHVQLKLLRFIVFKLYLIKLIL